MALGGGNFTTQNKILPGAYINFVSQASANAELSERGIVTMPLEMDWGREDDVFMVTNEDFQKNSLKIFGYAYDSEKLKGLRDLFIGARTLYAYRLNGGGEKAANQFAQAVYAGIRGNDIRISIQPVADEATLFEVVTYVENTKVDTQRVTAATELKDNGFVSFKSDAELAVTVSAPLAGGTNGTADVAAYQAYADKIESYSYNIMGIVTVEPAVKNLFVAFNRRLRDEMGIKFQLVLHEMPADALGVINVKNKTKDTGWSEASLVYWVSGAEAGCAVNKSCQNKRYDGEFTIDTAYTQTELSTAIKAGEFVLHRVNSEVRVLSDINSMVTVSDTCGEVFKENQTIRVIDQIANDDAVLFHTKYLGVVSNNASGRISLWSDLVKIRQTLQDMGAIENFEDSDVAVEQGENKKSVVITGSIEVVNAMDRLYMTVMVA